MTTKSKSRILKFSKLFLINYQLGGFFNMSMSNAKVFGLTDQVIQLMKDNKDALLAEGLDVTNKITELGGLRDTGVAEAQKQDDMEVAAKGQTKVANGAKDKCYTKASSALDSVISALGKTTDPGKQAAKIRSSLIKQYKKKGSGSGNS